MTWSFDNSPKKNWLSACQSRCWLEILKKKTPLVEAQERPIGDSWLRFVFVNVHFTKSATTKNIQLGLRIGFGTGGKKLPTWEMIPQICHNFMHFRVRSGKKGPLVVSGVFPFFVPLGELSPLWASGQHAWRQISRCRRRIPREAWGHFAMGMGWISSFWTILKKKKETSGKVGVDPGLFSWYKRIKSYLVHFCQFTPWIPSIYGPENWVRHPKRKRSFSKHRFSDAKMLVSATFGTTTNLCNTWFCVGSLWQPPQNYALLKFNSLPLENHDGGKDKILSFLGHFSRAVHMNFKVEKAQKTILLVG